MQNQRLAVDPASYTSLLSLIARAESSNNYNAYYGNAGNTSIKFTAMTVGEVMEWQRKFIEQGNASSAVGRYQIIDSTLAGLVTDLKIDTRQKFDEETQDTMAIVLVERRGSEEYLNKELSQEKFASNLAKEWASLPKVLGANPEESYYASDGLNKSLVNVSEIKKAIQPIRPK